MRRGALFALLFFVLGLSRLVMHIGDRAGWW